MKKIVASMFRVASVVAFLGLAPSAPAQQAGLLGHWPLAEDGRDVSGSDRHAEVRGEVQWAEQDGRAAVKLDGRNAFLEIPADRVPALGREDFTVSLWVNCPDDSRDLPGDLLSHYDAARRRGWHLTLKTNSGVTFSQSNYRHLQFGIDDDRQTDWQDAGRPGQALLGFALAAHEGSLYVGTCEPGPGESGHVYRYAGDDQWTDLGSPDNANSVTSLAVFEGQLYAGTGKYRVAGSALPESENTNLGGRIFRLDGDQWVACGQLPEVESVGGLAVYNGRLYASSLYRPAGFFRYEGGDAWTACAVPDEKRVEALGVYNGHLYATSYDGGRVYRFDGETWTDCGQLGDNTQTYSIAVYQGRLYVGTWPSGSVYRFEQPNVWTDVGRLGEELEVMGMMVHNGRLLGGTLPLAEVYAYQGDRRWQRLTQLDQTPDVKYRRAWTMAEYDGRLFCSTLPSGKIFRFQAGTTASWNDALPTGWHHVAAVRRGQELVLYVDGTRVAQARSEDLPDYDLTSSAPLRIGLGQNDFAYGALSDLRLYGRALDEGAIQKLAAPAE